MTTYRERAKQEDAHYVQNLEDLLEQTKQNFARERAALRIQQQKRVADATHELNEEILLLKSELSAVRVLSNGAMNAAEVQKESSGKRENELEKELNKCQSLLKRKENLIVDLTLLAKDRHEQISNLEEELELVHTEKQKLSRAVSEGKRSAEELDKLANETASNAMDAHCEHIEELEKEIARLQADCKQIRQVKDREFRRAEQHHRDKEKEQHGQQEKLRKEMNRIKEEAEVERCKLRSTFKAKLDVKARQIRELEVELRNSVTTTAAPSGSKEAPGGGDRDLQSSEGAAGTTSVDPPVILGGGGFRPSPSQRIAASSGAVGKFKQQAEHAEQLAEQLKGEKSAVEGHLRSVLADHRQKQKKWDKEQDELAELLLESEKKVEFLQQELRQIRAKLAVELEAKADFTRIEGEHKKEKSEVQPRLRLRSGCSVPEQFGSFSSSGSSTSGAPSATGAADPVVEDSSAGDNVAKHQQDTSIKEVDRSESGRSAPPPTVGQEMNTTSSTSEAATVKEKAEQDQVAKPVNTTTFCSSEIDVVDPETAPKNTMKSSVSPPAADKRTINTPSQSPSKIRNQNESLSLQLLEAKEENVKLQKENADLSSRLAAVRKYGEELQAQMKEDSERLKETCANELLHAQRQLEMKQKMLKQDHLAEVLALKKEQQEAAKLEEGLNKRVSGLLTEKAERAREIEQLKKEADHNAIELKRLQRKLELETETKRVENNRLQQEIRNKIEEIAHLQQSYEQLVGVQKEAAELGVTKNMDYEKREQDLAKTGAALDHRESDVAQQESANLKKEAFLKERDHVLKAKEQALTVAAAEIQKMREQIEAQQLQIQQEAQRSGSTSGTGNNKAETTTSSPTSLLNEAKDQEIALLKGELDQQKQKLQKQTTEHTEYEAVSYAKLSELQQKCTKMEKLQKIHRKRQEQSKLVLEQILRAYQLSGSLAATSTSAANAPAGLQPQQPGYYSNNPVVVLSGEDYDHKNLAHAAVAGQQQHLQQHTDSDAEQQQGEQLHGPDFHAISHAAGNSLSNSASSIPSSGTGSIVADPSPKIAIEPELIEVISNLLNSSWMTSCTTTPRTRTASNFGAQINDYTSTAAAAEQQVRMLKDEEEKRMIGTSTNLAEHQNPAAKTKDLALDRSQVGRDGGTGTATTSAVNTATKPTPRMTPSSSGHTSKSTANEVASLKEKVAVLQDALQEALDVVAKDPKAASSSSHFGAATTYFKTCGSSGADQEPAPTCFAPGARTTPTGAHEVVEQQQGSAASAGELRISGTTVETAAEKTQSQMVTADVENADDLHPPPEYTRIVPVASPLQQTMSSCSVTAAVPGILVSAGDVVGASSAAGGGTAGAVAPSSSSSSGNKPPSTTTTRASVLPQPVARVVPPTTAFFARSFGSRASVIAPGGAPGSFLSTSITTSFSQPHGAAGVGPLQANRTAPGTASVPDPRGAALGPERTTSSSTFSARGAIVQPAGLNVGPFFSERNANSSATTPSFAGLGLAAAAGRAIAANKASAGARPGNSSARRGDYVYNYSSSASTSSWSNSNSIEIVEPGGVAATNSDDLMFQVDTAQHHRSLMFQQHNATTLSASTGHIGATGSKTPNRVSYKQARRASLHSLSSSRSVTFHNAGSCGGGSASVGVVGPGTTTFGGGSVITTSSQSRTRSSVKKQIRSTLPVATSVPVAAPIRQMSPRWDVGAARGSSRSVSNSRAGGGGLSATFSTSRCRPTSARSATPPGLAQFLPVVHSSSRSVEGRFVSTARGKNAGNNSTLNSSRGTATSAGRGVNHFSTAGAAEDPSVPEGGNLQPDQLGILSKSNVDGIMDEATVEMVNKGAPEGGSWVATDNFYSNRNQNQVEGAPAARLVTTSTTTKRIRHSPTNPFQQNKEDQQNSCSSSDEVLVNLSSASSLSVVVAEGDDLPGAPVAEPSVDQQQAQYINHIDQAAAEPPSEISAGAVYDVDNSHYKSSQEDTNYIELAQRSGTAAGRTPILPANAGEIDL
ncbi:unnamed protein product [Amoebophrya sp. A120]|nr:unnamed protein product [Amoebophrya sp. A120]|eukprot:GSA120T00017072001.1